MTTTVKERYEVIERLGRLGISYDDAQTLRRIAMTLHRWHELECGDGNNYGSWAIERGECVHGGDAECCPNTPYLVHHHYRHGQGQDYTTRTRIPDREAGALKRLAKVMEKYPNLIHYVQGDPRGASLYILTLEDTKGYELDSIYNRGVAVY